MHKYQSYIGLTELRKSISKFYMKFFSVKLNPKNAVFFYNLGVAKGSQGKNIEALKDFKKTAYHLKSKIKINPYKDEYKIIKEKVKHLLAKDD